MKVIEAQLKNTFNRRVLPSTRISEGHDGIESIAWNLYGTLLLVEKKGTQIAIQAEEVRYTIQASECKPEENKNKSPSNHSKLGGKKKR